VRVEADQPRRRGFWDDTRGVKWTLQAHLFLFVLLGGVVIAGGSIPTEESPTEFSDVQREQLATDLLSVASGTDSLSRSVRYWNASGGRWIDAQGGANDTWYTTLRTTPSHPLWSPIDAGIENRQLGYNVEISYRTGVNETRESLRVVYQGPPGPDAVSATRSVVLSDDDAPVVGPTSNDGDPCTLEELGDDSTTGSSGCQSGSFFAPDAAPGSSRYNVIDIRVTVWRI